MNILQLEQEVLQLKKEFKNLQMDDPFLKPAEVAEFYNISRGSAYTLFMKPTFPGKKIAGTYRVRRSQLYKYFDDLPKY